MRTSTTRVTPWARSSPTNSSRGWVEWPIVSTTGEAIESGFGLRATVEAFNSDAFIDERNGCLLLVADPAPSQFDLPPDLEDLAAALVDQPSRFIELLDRDSRICLRVLPWTLSTLRTYHFVFALLRASFVFFVTFAVRWRCTGRPEIFICGGTARQGQCCTRPQVMQTGSSAASVRRNPRDSPLGRPGSPRWLPPRCWARQSDLPPRRAAWCSRARRVPLSQS